MSDASQLPMPTDDQRFSASGGVMTEEPAQAIPHEVLVAARRRLYHRIMAALHVAMAESGLTYAELAGLLSWRERDVRRAFYDESFWRGTGIDRMSDLAFALGRDWQITLRPTGG